MTARRVLVILLAGLGIWLWLAPGASAHAELVGSTPAAGTTAATAPARVTLRFSEGVTLKECAVAADGRELALSQPAGEPTVVVADLTPLRGHSGRLTLNWRSVSSDDGHVATGSLSFTVRGTPAAGSAAPALPQPDPVVKDLLTADQGVEFAALVLLVGGLAFLTLIWPDGTYEPRVRRLLTGAWIAGLAAAIATPGLQDAYDELLPLGRVASPHTYADVLGTHLGTVLAARALLWLLAAVVLTSLLQRGPGAARSPGWRVGALAVAFGLERTVSQTGHDDAIHPLFGAAVDTVHVAAVSLWLGGLVTLVVGVLPRRRPDELAYVVPRWSRLALASVITIASAGVVLAWQVVGSTHALLHSSFGHVLLLKLAVICAGLAVAGINNGWIRHRLDIAVLLDGDRATVRPFIYSVAAETGIVLVVLALASVLVTANPGR